MSDVESNTGSSESSDWNEQNKFSELYFRASLTARDCQFKGETLGWFKAVENKFQAAGMVCKPEEMKKLKELGMEATIARNKYNHNSMLSKSESVLAGYHTESPSELSWKRKLESELTTYEMAIDQLVNTKMPFLNKQKKIDMGGF